MKPFIDDYTKDYSPAELHDLAITIEDAISLADAEASISDDHNIPEISVLAP